MKNNETTYSKKSLLDIQTDTYVVQRGSVTRNNSLLIFGANSQCKFTKTYGKGKKPVDKLKVEYDVYHSISTRYNNKFGIRLNLLFWEKEYNSEENEYDYVEGTWQSVEIIPYNNTEDTGNYKFDEINTNGKFLKEMEVVMTYKGTTGTVEVSYANIFMNILEPEKVVNALNEYTSHGGTYDMVIPTYEEMPDIDSLPEGAVWKLSTIA